MISHRRSVLSVRTVSAYILPNIANTASWNCPYCGQALSELLILMTQHPTERGSWEPISCAVMMVGHEMSGEELSLLVVKFVNTTPGQAGRGSHMTSQQ